jgi:hypothetical protein
MQLLDETVLELAFFAHEKELEMNKARAAKSETFSGPASDSRD